MTSNQMILLTGNRQMADEGMVAWLIMRLSGLAFEHRLADADRPDFAELLVDGETIANSIGIATFIGELVPEIWPDDSRARAHARSIAADAFGQMHDFKAFLPMAITEQFMPTARLLRRTSKDLERLGQRWNRLLALNHGHFLFGEFSAADAFQASLAARCVTYGLELDRDCEAYVDAVMSFPLVAEWQSLAASESRASMQFEGKPLLELLAGQDTMPGQPANEPSEREVALDQPGNTEAPVAGKTTPTEPKPAELDAAKPGQIEKNLPDLDETLPFRVDLQDQSSLAKTVPPAIIRPREGKGLFQRKNRRVLTNPYRSASADKVSVDPEVAETSDGLMERPQRSGGIKPIGGEIRRRR